MLAGLFAVKQHEDFDGGPSVAWKERRPRPTNPLKSEMRPSKVRNLFFGTANSRLFTSTSARKQFHYARTRRVDSPFPKCLPGFNSAK